MLKASLIVCLVILTAALPPALAQSDQPDVAQTPTAQQLAIQSLRDSAFALFYKDESPARAKRLIALTQFAHKLGTDAKTDWLRAFIAKSQGDQAGEAEALRSIVDSSPQDYANVVLWLELVLGQASNVEEKTALLDSIIADENLPEATRSFGLARKARLLIDQGQLGLAALAMKDALKLDPFNFEALRIRRLELNDSLSKADLAQIRLAELSGDLFSEKPAWQLAGWLSEIGLHRESLPFYEYTWLISSRRASPTDQTLALAIDFLNAVIDAEEYVSAIQKLSEILKYFKGNTELALLAIEAARGAGQAELAENLMGQLDEQFQSLSASGELDPEQTRQAAQFYLVIKDDPAAALEIMGSDLAGQGGDDLFIQRIIGAGELASEDPDEASIGRTRLGRIMDRDVYSAALVARYEFAKGNSTAAREAIDIGLESPRSGPAYRMLRSVAMSANVVIEDLPGIDNVRAELESFDMQYLEAGHSTGKFLTLTIKPTSEIVSFCQPIEVEVVLTNIGPIGLPIVPPAGGPVQPQMVLSVVVKGRVTQEFDDLPKVTLPAPRYLEPDQRVSAKIRIDLGSLGDYLNDNPFTDLRLTISGVFAPIGVDDRIISAMPSLFVSPASIDRQGLFSTYGLDPQQDLAGTYQKSLGYIVRDIKYGTLPQRLRSARQVGSLLGIVRRPRRQRYGVPRSVSAVLDELVLVRMLQEVLKDSDPLVRAEMLAGLNGVSINDVILRELGPVIEDPDPLVRFRLAETIGLSGSSGRQTVLTYLSQDSNEMVRQMAKAVQGIE